MRRLLVLVCVCVSACGGDSKNPVAATPTVSSIVVSGAALITLGSSEVFTASSTLSNGTSSTPSCAWNTDAGYVATVDSSGRATGNQSGDVTISCTAQGSTGSKRTRVLPGYAGVWGGNYGVTGCTQSGQVATLVDPCSTFRAGTVLPYAFNLAQTGDAVSGRFFFGSIQFDQTSGAVATNGDLTLTSRSTSGTLGIDAIWRVNSPGAGRLTGNFSQLWRDSTLTGELNLTGEITTGARGTAAVRTNTGIHSLKDGLDALTAR